MPLIISQLSRQTRPPFPSQGCTHPLQPARMPSFLLLLPLPSPSLLSRCSNPENSHLPSRRSTRLMARCTAQLPHADVLGWSQLCSSPAGRKGILQALREMEPRRRRCCQAGLLRASLLSGCWHQRFRAVLCQQHVWRGILEVSHLCSGENPSSHPTKPVAGVLPCQLECQGVEAGC